MAHGDVTDTTELWTLWNVETDRRATVAAYFSRERAVAEIERYILRQANGGRPDVDATVLAPRRIR